jgi:hypothetical protein
VAHTGTAQRLFPTIGSWASYGLGSLNQNLPDYVVLGADRGLLWHGGRTALAIWDPSMVSD